MFINIKKMEAQGFDVSVNTNKGWITIQPFEGVRLDWTPMVGQLDKTGLNEAEIGTAMEKFEVQINETQVLKAIRNCQ